MKPSFGLAFVVVSSEQIKLVSRLALSLLSVQNKSIMLDVCLKGFILWSNVRGELNSVMSFVCIKKKKKEFWCEYFEIRNDGEYVYRNEECQIQFVIINFKIRS